MDAFPLARGHVLVVHKRAAARNLLDIEPADLHAVMTTVRRLTRAVSATLKPDGVMISQFNGAAAGQTIFHMHVHIIPRWADVPLGRHVGGMVDMAELSALAGQIAANL